MEHYEGKALTDGQKRFIDLVKNSTGGQITYLGGEAGTGKSLAVHAVLRELRSNRFSDEDSICMVAPTGVAAIPFGGITLWNLLGMVPGDEFKTPEEVWAKMDPDVNKKSSFKYNRIRRLKYLFCDEISMVSRQFWIKMDFILRRALGVDLPMGGLIVVVIGDFHQLPPVIKDNPANVDKGGKRKRQTTLEGGDVDDEDGMLIFFPEFNDKLTNVVILDENKRQEGDIPMIYCLQCIRRGPDFMDDYVWECLNWLRVPLEYRQLTNPDLAVPQVFPRRAQVYETNRNYLRSLNGPLLIVKSIDMCTFNDPRKPWLREQYSRNTKESLNKGVTVEETVALREGAVVMYLRNDNDHHLVNGSRGVITKIEWPASILEQKVPENKRCLQIDLEQDGEMALPPIWGKFEIDARTGQTQEVLIKPENFELKYREDRSQTRYVRKQLALHVGPAVTVHKAQGQTFSVMKMEEMSSSFAPGQVYTTITRGTNFQGLELVGNFGPESVICDERISEWYTSHESPNAGQRFQELKEKAHAMGPFRPLLKPEYADYKPDGEIRAEAVAELRAKKRAKFSNQDDPEKDEQEKPPNVVAVFGSFRFKNYDTFRTLMNKMRESMLKKGEPIVKLISGDHPLGGVDNLIKQYAEEEKIPYERFELVLKEYTLDEVSEDEEEEEQTPRQIVERPDYVEKCEERNKRIIASANKVVVIKVAEKSCFCTNMAEDMAGEAGKPALVYTVKKNWQKVKE